MAPREERIKRQNELLLLYPEVREELMKIPGVSSVAVGLKEINNQLTDEIVFQVFVDEKIDEKDLERGAIIPREIKGIKTDVHLTHYGATLRNIFDQERKGDEKEYRPLKAGIMVGYGIGGGTLGCFARLVKGNGLVMLTNHHVIAEDREEGAPVGQPQYNRRCCCCCAYDEFKTGVLLKKGIRTEKVDAALATIDAGIEYESIINNSKSNGHTLRIEGTAIGAVGDKVRKIGQLSGHTMGIITTVKGTIPAGLVSEKEMVNQMFIKPDPKTPLSEFFIELLHKKQAFSDKGDSGAVIINEQDMVVGLLIGGNPEVDPLVDITYANNIQDVLDALKNDDLEIIIEKSKPKADKIKQQPQGQVVNKTVRPETELKEKLLQHEEGKKWMNIFDRHYKEILDLVNHDRHVAATWQRNQGPAFIAHLVNSAKDPLYIIPQTVESITLQHLLVKMIAVLKAKGSASLQADISSYGLDLIEYAAGLNSVNEIFTKLHEKSMA